MAGDDIRQYSLDEIILMNKRSDVSPTGGDAPSIELDDDFWRDATVVMPGDTTAVQLRIDAETFHWFRVQDDEPLARMSAVLRSYAQAQRRRPQR